MFLLLCMCWPECEKANIHPCADAALCRSAHLTFVLANLGYNNIKVKTFKLYLFFLLFQTSMYKLHRINMYEMIFFGATTFSLSKKSPNKKTPNIDLTKFSKPIPQLCSLTTGSFLDSKPDFLQLLGQFLFGDLSLRPLLVAPSDAASFGYSSQIRRIFGRSFARRYRVVTNYFVVLISIWMH